MNVWQLFSFTLTQIFLHIIVNFKKLGCKILSVHHFNALQHFIHTESWVLKRSIISQPYYVSFTDNLSVPQTMDYSVNQGFAKLVSSTDNSSIIYSWQWHCFILATSTNKTAALNFFFNCKRTTTKAKTQTKKKAI